MSTVGIQSLWSNAEESARRLEKSVTWEIPIVFLLLAWYRGHP